MPEIDLEDLNRQVAELLGCKPLARTDGGWECTCFDRSEDVYPHGNDSEFLRDITFAEDLNACFSEHGPVAWAASKGYSLELDCHARTVIQPRVSVILRGPWGTEEWIMAEHDSPATAICLAMLALSKKLQEVVNAGRHADPGP